MNFVMKPEIDFEIEAKRSIVVHDLEKLANNMLSDLNIENITNMQYGAKKMCQQAMPWKDNQFWEELPNPNTVQKQKHVNNVKSIKQPKPQCLPFINKPEQKHDLQSKHPDDMKVEGNNLCQKYFCKWKICVKNKQEHKKQLLEKIEQGEKLDKFLKMLKKCKNKTQKQNSCKTPIKLQYTLNRSEENLTQNKSPTTGPPRNKTAEGTCYQHRYKAQQSIIELQKQKLKNQEKLINELQFGKLNEEIKQSMNESQEIKQTLSKCSIKVKCQIAPIQTTTFEEDFLKFQINSGKAPKILQQMEKRALEREERRRIIFERKRILDKKKKEAIELEIENKRTLDEEERKKTLREIKERRQREMEIQIQIQIKKQKFLDNCLKADKFYRTKLIKLTFKGFLKLISIKENNIIKSEEFCDNKRINKAWKGWIKFMEIMESKKMYKIDCYFNSKLKKKIFKEWLKIRITSLQHIQVAEDFYEFRVQSKFFIHWHRYTCTQYVLQLKNLQKAQRHHNSRIIFHYFYQWKSLPTVIQLEKTKEEKKRRWREKVWEILPDYRPPIED